jgi:arginine decarboxylase
VREALAEHPRAVAVFLGEPSYVGTVGDLAGHAEVAHAAGVPLVVDAAWGAHFGLHPALPPHPLAAGADAVVTSAHKMLPAISQGALVLARTARLDAGRLDRAFDATHTTSPTGAILASVDAARALVERSGAQLAERLVEAVAAARVRLAAVPGLRVLAGPLADGSEVDAAKLVVLLAGTGAHGVVVERDLVAAGYPVEMADRDTIVAIATLADDPETIAAFADELARSVERYRDSPRGVVAAAAWTVEPEQVLAPREAFFAEQDRLPAAMAVGHVSAELVAPYPPGVPVLAPGERITGSSLAALRAARDDGALIAYAADPTLATLAVVRA